MKSWNYVITGEKGVSGRENPCKGVRVGEQVLCSQEGEARAAAVASGAKQMVGEEVEEVAGAQLTQGYGS